MRRTPSSRRPGPRSSASARSTRIRSQSSSSASTGRRSSRPGSSRATSPRSSTTRGLAPRPGSSTTTRAACSTGSFATSCCAPLRPSVSGVRRRPPTTTSSCCGPSRARRRLARSTLFASRWPSATGGPILRSQTSSRRPTAASRTTSARSRSRPVTAWTSSSRAFEARPTTMGRSSSKALADRLAEALAERLHERVRRELWGYAPDEDADERRAHRRVVPGHPTGPRLPGSARPHREGHDLRAARGRDARGHPPDRVLRDVARGVGLGAYFWRPEARYFGLGRIGRDQLEDYARRKSMPLDVMAPLARTESGRRCCQLSGRHADMRLRLTESHSVPGRPSPRR